MAGLDRLVNEKHLEMAKEVNKFADDQIEFLRKCGMQDFDIEEAAGRPLEELEGKSQIRLWLESLPEERSGLLRDWGQYSHSMDAGWLITDGKTHAGFSKWREQRKEVWPLKEWIRDQDGVIPIDELKMDLVNLLEGMGWISLEES